MKNQLKAIKRASAFALLTALSPLVTKAVPITGGVAFGGVAILNNADPTLATSVGIPLAFGAASVGSFTPSIGVGTPIAFTSPLVDGVTSGLLWTGGAGPVFTFTASGPVSFVGADPNSLGIVASGIVDDGPGGFDATPAVFAMAITRTAGVIGAFGTITTPTENPVPDSANTLVLLGLCFGGFAATRRRFAVPGMSAETL
jgi:hypothetical protein